MVIVKDAPAFVVNRLLTRFMGEVTDSMDEGTPYEVADAAIARVDTKIAEREAAKDRNALLEEKGDDANHSTEKIVEIRKTISGN